MFKKIFGLILFISLGIVLQAQEINKYQEVKWLTWNEAYPQFKKSNKILLIDVYTDWCGWCKKMDKDTYAKPEVANLINKHFIAVKFNPEKTDIVYQVDDQKWNGRQLHYNLVQGQSSGFPTTIFLFKNDKGATVYLEPGYKDAVNFTTILNKYISMQNGN